MKKQLNIATLIFFFGLCGLSLYGQSPRFRVDIGAGINKSFSYDEIIKEQFLQPKAQIGLNVRLIDNLYLSTIISNERLHFTRTPSTHTFVTGIAIKKYEYFANLSGIGLGLNYSLFFGENIGLTFNSNAGKIFVTKNQSIKYYDTQIENKGSQSMRDQWTYVEFGTGLLIRYNPKTELGMNWSTSRYLMSFLGVKGDVHKTPNPNNFLFTIRRQLNITKHNIKHKK
ncbi:MAG: hypothetical protein JXQ87_17820 [Bacteroidia bacterium]